MSFSARLGQDDLSVEAGATTPLSIQIANTGEAPCQFEISIEGLDPDWTAIPVPLVTLQPGTSASEKVFLKPPRTSESAAGSYPFVVKVRSFESGEIASQQASLTIRPYHHISLEITPKKGSTGPLIKNNRFSVTVLNLGNSQHTLQMFASDPEDGCLYEFEADQVQLAPGQERTLSLTAAPKSKKYLGAKLYGFSISARSIEHQSIMGTAQAQLEQKPAVSLTTIILGLFIAAIVALWIALIPKTPSFDLAVSSLTATVGQPITISWRPASGQENVVIIAQEGQVYSGDGSPGQIAYTPTEPGTLNIEGYAVVRGKQSLHEKYTVTVSPPPVVLPATIDDFHLDSNKLILGQPFTVHYKVSNAAKVVLLPVGKSLDPTLDEIQIEADNPDTKTYTLVATNSAGASVRKKVDVTVVQPSQAIILSFTGSPTDMPGPGTVALQWQVNDKAVRVELSQVGQPTQVVQTMGNLTVGVSQTTTFVLTAYDDKGITTVKSVKVTVTPPPPIPGDPGSGAGSDSGGSAGSLGDTGSTTPISGSGAATGHN